MKIVLLLGFDVIYVDDIAATRNGPAAYENTRLTANYTSKFPFFRTNVRVLPLIKPLCRFHRKQ